MQRQVGPKQVDHHVKQAQKSRFAQPPPKVVDSITKAPEKPAEVVYLFEYFMQIAGRASHPHSPISYQDIMAFICTMSVPLLPWEVVVITSLDDLRLLTHDALDKLAKAEDA